MGMAIKQHRKETLGGIPDLRTCVIVTARKSIAGENSPCARLSSEEVAAIRAAPKQYGDSFELSERFGISRRYHLHSTQCHGSGRGLEMAADWGY